MFADFTPTPIVSYGDNGTAAINISGPLSPDGPGFIELFLGIGGTSYYDIASAADSLREDERVSEVRLVMGTPGGLISGMDMAVEALSRLASEKTVIAENHSMIASAGYALASTADRIVAVTPFAKTGSIGVLMAGVDNKQIVIVSKNAPFKAPDIGSEEGRQVYQDEIDATERVFIKMIADARGVSSDHVIENYGKGALLIAQDPDPDKSDALSSGLIDEVAFSRTGSVVNDNLSAGPTKYEDLPMIDEPWDSSAANTRVREFLDSTEAPSNSYRRAFFWYNSSEPENFGSYKLPFADVRDGRLVANIRGVNAANGAMSGARERVDIPDADRPGVQRHIDRYRSKWDRQTSDGASALNPNPNEETVNMDLNTLKAEHPDVYEAAVNEASATQVDEAVQAAKGTAAKIFAMAMEHNVSKETAIAMLNAGTTGEAAEIALAARSTDGAQSQGGDLDNDDPAEAKAKDTAEFAANFAKNLKLN